MQSYSQCYNETVYPFTRVLPDTNIVHGDSTSGDMLILSKPLNKQTRSDIVKIPNRLIEFDVWIFQQLVQKMRAVHVYLTKCFCSSKIGIRNIYLEHKFQILIYRLCLDTFQINF